MADFFAGPSGNNSNNGTTWALRRLTIVGLETLLASGDRGIIGPGTYREVANAGTSGGSLYTVDTASVTNGSKVVTSLDGLWAANAFANGWFQVGALASGSNGVGNGTTTFTSAAGNFQAGHVGKAIRITGQGTYWITARASATSITLSGSPASASGLTYHIGPETPYEIASVDSDTQITLKTAWSGPTLTSIKCETWKAITWLGDEGGTLTDGIGGEIRITGSDDDKVFTRANCLTFSAGISYRVFRGIHFDTTSSVGITFNATSGHIIFDQCVLQQHTGSAISVASTGTNNTVRRCKILNNKGEGAIFTNGSTANNIMGLVEDCEITGCSSGVRSDRVGGVVVRNCTLHSNASGVRVGVAVAAGQHMVVTMSRFSGNGSANFVGTAVTDILEDYNESPGTSNANHTNTSTGTNTNTWPMLLAVPLLSQGIRAVIPAMPHPSDQTTSLAGGANPPGDDINATTRSSPSSWGAVQYVAGQRPVDAGPVRSRPN